MENTGTTACPSSLTLPLKCFLFPQSVQQLLERGVDVNQYSREGFAPLCIAAFWGYADIAEHLLKHGYVLRCTCVQLFVRYSIVWTGLICNTLQS